MSDNTYNGWTNYETWNVALWLDNDEGTYSDTREMARDLSAEIDDLGSPSEYWTKEQAKRFTLADLLKNYVEEMNADALTGASLATDLLGYALACVDWNEIAAAILSDWPES